MILKGIDIPTGHFFVCPRDLCKWSCISCFWRGWAGKSTNQKGGTPDFLASPVTLFGHGPRRGSPLLSVSKGRLGGMAACVLFFLVCWFVDSALGRLLALVGCRLFRSARCLVGCFVEWSYLAGCCASFLICWPVAWIKVCLHVLFRTDLNLRHASQLVVWIGGLGCWPLVLVESNWETTLGTPPKHKSKPPSSDPLVIVDRFFQEGSKARSPFNCGFRGSETVIGCRSVDGRNPHHFEAMGKQCLWAFTGESSFQGFLGGAGLRPSTVCLCRGLVVMGLCSMPPVLDRPREGYVSLTDRGNVRAVLKEYADARLMGFGGF